MIKPTGKIGNARLGASVSKLLAWYSITARDLPWRRKPDPYGVWISEVMLQQTQVATVIPYWRRWMEALPTPAALAAATEAQVLKLWEGLGYYSRARNLKKAAEIILREHSGHFPQEIELVRALPGVGEYTAGAVCSIAFDQPEAAVDGNVARVLARLHVIQGDPRSGPAKAAIWAKARAWMSAAAKLPRTDRPCGSLTQALMELGALVCTPRQPRCEACPLRRSCQARALGLVAEYPQLAARTKSEPRRFVVLVIRRGSEFLARQRPPGGVNAGLWEFPNFEVGVKDPEGAASVLKPFHKLAPRQVMRLKHSITRYRITLEVFAARREANPAVTELEGVWLDWAAMRTLAFASAHGKIAKHLADPDRPQPS